MASCPPERGEGALVDSYRVAGGGGPGTVAGNADDGTLVNVAGADEALWGWSAHGVFEAEGWI